MPCLMSVYNIATINYIQANSSRYFFILFGFLFLLNPLASIFCGAIWLMLKKNPADSELRFWFALLALWISLVNITKIPVSDQLMYQRWYENLANLHSIKGIFQYSGSEKVYKEPIYGLFQFICYVVSGGSVKWFYFLTSFIGYFLLLDAVKIVLLKAGQGKLAVIFGAVCCVFFNQYLYLTLHLMRQVLAFSVVLYAFALRINDGKNHWVPLLCAPMIHTTAALFSLLILIPFIYHRMNVRQTIYFIIPLVFVTVGSIAFGTFVISVIGENGGAGYAFKRLGTAVTDGMNSSPIVVAIMIIPLAIISFINLIRLRRGGKSTYHSPLYPVIYIFLFLAIFILSMSTRPLIQYRFVFVTYQMMPFIVPLLLTPKNRFRGFYFFTAGIVFIVRFFITLPQSQFKFMISTEEMLFWPAPFYFFAS